MVGNYNMQSVYKQWMSPEWKLVQNYGPYKLFISET